ncbi:MAG: PAS domain-containing protein [Firmicutes bacterium]|nr:PAS domain-containing protein [Bacillota bacterium]
MLTGIQKSDQVPFLMATLSCIGDGIIVTDPRGKVLYINASAEILTGWGGKEALNRPFAEIFPLVNYYSGEAQENPIFKALRQEESVGLKNHTALVTRTGRRFFVSANCSPIYNRGGTAEGVVVVFRDIDRIKNIEEEVRRGRDAAQAASRIKSEFIANMSHEIRTPLNGLMGMLELLLKTKMTPEQRELIQMLEISANNLLHVIGGILDYSQIEAGKIKIKNIPFDLEALLDELLAIHGVLAQKKGLKLSHELSPTVPRRVMGDPDRLRQILNNLVGNAIKFTDEGQVTVSVGSGSGGGLDSPLEFRVTDTGIGIAPEKLDLLFQRFSQVDGSITRRYRGTGLGLAISKQLAELMGGTIAVQSEVGRGSTFILRVNLAPSDGYTGNTSRGNFGEAEGDSSIILTAEDGPRPSPGKFTTSAGQINIPEGHCHPAVSGFIFSEDEGEVFTKKSPASPDTTDTVKGLHQLSLELKELLQGNKVSLIEGTAREVKRVGHLLDDPKLVELAFRAQLASRKGQGGAALEYCGLLIDEIERRRDEGCGY